MAEHALHELHCYAIMPQFALVNGEKEKWLTNGSTSLQVTQQLLQQERATPSTQILQQATACSCGQPAPVHCP